MAATQTLILQRFYLDVLFNQRMHLVKDYKSPFPLIFFFYNSRQSKEWHKITSLSGFQNYTDGLMHWKKDVTFTIIVEQCYLSKIALYAYSSSTSISLGFNNKILPRGGLWSSVELVCIWASCADLCLHTEADICINLLNTVKSGLNGEKQEINFSSGTGGYVEGHKLWYVPNEVKQRRLLQTSLMVTHYCCSQILESDLEILFLQYVTGSTLYAKVAKQFFEIKCAQI